MKSNSAHVLAFRRHWGQDAVPGEGHLDVTVNSVKLMEGDIKGQSRSVPSDQLRKESGTEGVFADTCAYDDAGKRIERRSQKEVWIPRRSQKEVWIPLKDKPRSVPWTRAEAFAELRK